MWGPAFIDQNTDSLLVKGRHWCPTSALLPGGFGPGRSSQVRACELEGEGLGTEPREQSAARALERGTVHVYVRRTKIDPLNVFACHHSTGASAPLMTSLTDSTRAKFYKYEQLLSDAGEK